ncbi:MAG: peptidylprolyl isomerase [Planctomycetes bacterium]|nr:peptidylprolyl isomerase [Planctomycetota bacterium]
MRLHHRSSILFPAALVLAGSVCVPAFASARQEPSSTAPAPLRASSEIVIARVEGRSLTLDEAIQTFLSAHTGHGVLVRGEPAVRELAGRLVERELFLLEAESLGLQDDADVQHLVTSYAKEVAVDALWQSEIKDKVKVTDEDVESFYSKTDVALRLTLVEAATREVAEALRARVLAGEDMAAIARKESTHSSRTFDGSLPYVRRGELERALEDAAFALENPASLTPVVQTEKGYTFLRLEERSINPERPPRDKALPQIRGILEERLQKKLVRELEDRAHAAANVWIDEAQLTREAILDGPDDSIVVARAADDSLTLKDVRDGLQLDAMRAAPPESTKTIGVELVKQWVRAEALKALAATTGFTDAPAVQAKCRSFRRDVMMKTLCDRYVWPNIEPSEEDVRAFYEANKEKDFTTAPEVRLAYMVLSTDEEARGVLAQIAAGDSFEALARERSKDSASSVHGGRIGWVKPGTLLPEVETRAFALAVNAVDGPIETEVGFFIVKALERKEPRIVSYPVARETAYKRIVKDRQGAAYAKWAIALRERAAVELDEAGVQDAVQWLEQEALKREAEKAAAPKKDFTNAPPGHGPAPVIPSVKKTEDKP